MNETKYCKYCGEIIDSDSIICPKCGKQVEIPTSVEINSTPQPTANNIIINPSIVVSPKNKIVALILAILLGGLGIHRFYVGKIGTGIIWFLTAGCFGIGWIYDIIKIATGTFRDGAGMVISQ